MGLKSDISHSRFQGELRTQAEQAPWRASSDSGRCRWWGSCRRGAPRSTPARGAILPPSTASSRRATTRSSGRTLEEGCFDLMFFDDRLAMPGIYGGSVAEAVLRGRPPGEARPEHRARRRRRRHPLDRARRHLLDDLLLAVPRRPHLRHARPPLRRPGRLERRHLGERQRGPELRGRRAPRPRRALRPRRRVPRGDDRACGTRGRTTPSSSTGRTACSPIPTRSTSSTTTASGSRSAAR